MDSNYSIVTIVQKRTTQLYNLIKNIEQASCRPSEVIIVWMGPPCSESLLTSEFFTIRHKFVANDTLPIAKARNKGFQCSSNASVVYLDVDCILPPDLFTAMLAELSPGRVVTPRVHYLTEVPESPVYEQLISLAIPPQHANAPLGKPLGFDCFRTMAFAMQLKDFNATGGFDEEFSGVGAGDIDFATRCALNKFELFKVAPVVLHPQHKQLTPPILHLCDIVNNAARYKQKWGVYPMRGCLQEFVSAGLINEDFDQTGLRVKRIPTPEEISATVASTAA